MIMVHLKERKTTLRLTSIALAIAIVLTSGMFGNIRLAKAATASWHITDGNSIRTLCGGSASGIPGDAFTAEYMIADGTEYTSNYAGIPSTIPNAYLKGYTFDGWYYTTDTVGSNSSWTKLTESNFGEFLYKSHTYTVTIIPSMYKNAFFYVNGGNVGDVSDIVNDIIFPNAEQKRYEVPVNGISPKEKLSSLISNPESTCNLSRSGYTFKDWNTKADGTGSTIGLSDVTKSTIVYAQWEANSYKVTYDVNEGMLPANEGNTFSVTYDSAYGNLLVPTRLGYTFDGWYTEKTGGSKIINTTNVSIAKDHTIYAHWSANTYTVSLNTMGGKCAQDSMEVTYDSTYGNLPIPEKVGYAFDGWYTAAEGGSKIVSDTKVTFTDNQTLYAHWTFLWNYDSTNKVMSIYSQDSAAIEEWNIQDSNVFDAAKVIIGPGISDISEIPLDSFGNATQIVVVSGNNNYSSSQDGILYDKAKETLIYCPIAHPDDPEIEGTCTEIGSNAFAGTKNVITIRLPYSVISAKAGAFNSETIKQLIVKNPEVIFENETVVSKVTKIYGFKNSTAIAYAEANSLPNSIYDVIEDNFFENSQTMESFTVPDNILSIGEDAFRNCNNLKAIELSSTVKSLGNYAFAENEQLTDVDLESVEEIGSYCFAGDISLAKLTIPDTVTKIGDAAFKNVSIENLFMDVMECEVFDSADTIPTTNTIECYYGSAAYNYAVKYGNPFILRIGYDKDGTTDTADYNVGNANIVKLKVGPDLIKIGNNAFTGANCLTSIEFDDSSILESIEESAFADTGISKVILPESVKTLGNDVFSECKSLIKIDYSDTEIKSIPENAFSGNSALTEFNMNDITEVIGKNAFLGCESLTVISLSDSVKEICQGAYAGCNNVAEITIENQNCDIYRSEDTLPEYATIKGYTSSTAHVFAETYGRTFESIGNAYLVQFDMKGGTEGTSSIYVVNGKEMPEITIPVKTGYSFSGYYSSSDCGGTQYYGEDGSSIKEWNMTTGSILYAGWISNTFNVTLNANGGTIQAGNIESYKYGTITELPTQVYQEGYDFMGWFDESGNRVTAIGDTEKGDKNYTAQWSLKSLTLTFNTCGGISESARKLAYGSTYGNLPEAYYDNHIFLGWYDSVSGGNKVSSTDVILDDVTIYAHWSKEISNNTIPANYMKGNTEIQEISIPSGVTSIEADAFKGCENLKSVILPETLSSIAGNAFRDCKNLTQIVLPENLVSIGDNAFDGSGLKEITIPKGAVLLGKEIFKDSENLETAQVDSDIDRLPEGIFSGCSALKNVTLSSTITILGKSAFAQSGFENIDLPYSILEIEQRAFAECPYLMRVSIGNPMCSIYDAEDTFTNNQINGSSTVLNGYSNSTCKDYAETYGYESASLGDSYKISFDSNGGSETETDLYILPGKKLKSSVMCPTKSDADFMGYYLKEMQIYDAEGKIVTDIAADKSMVLVAKWSNSSIGFSTGGNVTGGTDNQNKAAIGSKSTSSASQKAVQSKKSYTISGVTYKISGKSVKVYKVNKSRKKVVIPATITINKKKYKVTTINASAFKNCKKLKNVTIGKNVQKIGKEAFKGCKKLKKITIKSKSLKSIGKNALTGINKKASIKVSKSRLKKYKALLTVRTGFLKKTMKLKK